MTTLEDLKKAWDKNQAAQFTAQPYNELSLKQIFRSRVKKHMKASMQYFWASFVLQIMVYALLSNVIVTHWSDKTILALSIGGVLLYIPFTIMLMKKFKAIASAKLIDQRGTSLHQYVSRHHALLTSFYRFKKRYELLLIPVSCAIGTILTFMIYVPGGVYAHFSGAVITFIIAIVSCAVAIRAENIKSFERPLQQIKGILNEFQSEA